MTVTYPLRLMFDCSTAHLSPASREYLANVAGAGDEMVACTRYGWFVWAGGDANPDHPADLSGIIAHAWARDADYILFDCDAKISTALPTFEWSP